MKRTLLRLSSQTGCVDIVNHSFIQGWAYNPEDPTRPAVVEALLQGRCVWRGPADQYREDIERLGLRGGRCGFVIPLSEIPKVRRKQSIELRIIGSQRPLATLDVPERGALDFIALDIVNNCNLRCPFCLVDYSRVKTTEVMSDETFRRTLSLCNAVGDGWFALSCLHEPTLHPRFGELLGMLPGDRAKRFYFTTNLAKPLSDAMLHSWANSGIQHINISLDSLNPEVFPVLRKFGRLKVFEDNLDRLVRIFREHPSPPLLRYITMAFRSNMAEIPDLVLKTGDSCLSSEHEIRYTYNMEHIQDEFRRTEYLSPAEWHTVNSALAGIPHKYLVVTPPPTPEDIVEVFPSANYRNSGTGAEWYGGQIVRPVILRVLVDGTIMVGGHENRWSVNINDIGDPETYFEDLLASEWFDDIAPDRNLIPGSSVKR